ncbi:MAG: radical SAM protein [Ethanoligenens sp.]
MTNTNTARTLSRKEIIQKYPHISPYVILKADIQRRTVVYTDQALQKADPDTDQGLRQTLFGSVGVKETFLPASFMLRDGSSALTVPIPSASDPYVVDAIDGKLVLIDHGEVVDEITFWPRPDFQDKTTSRGTPMWSVANARAQRLDIDPHSYCQFCNNGSGCLYCNVGPNYIKSHKEYDRPARLDPRDVYETVHEALKERGRYTYIKMTAGSILTGKELFDDEVEMYIKILKAIGDNFKTRRFPSQMISSSFNERQLERLYNETGIMNYTSDMEVLNPEKFAWICPGKEKVLGYHEWKNRIIRAVDIFGRGHVDTGIVGGVELAQPNGFATEDIALQYTLEEAEDFAAHGVFAVACVWVPYPGSPFEKQQSPSLEYYVRLAEGLDRIRRQYNLPVDMDDYRRCGNHPDTDLSRVNG